MKIFNDRFEILPDRNTFILNEYKVYNKGENKWESYISDTTYPPTFQACLKKIRHRLPKKASTIDEYIEKLDEIDKSFNQIIEWI